MKIYSLNFPDLNVHWKIGDYDDVKIETRKFSDYIRHQEKLY